MDALLLGRKTWEIWETYWPHHDGGDPVSHGINVLPKYVPSTTLKDPTWQNTHVIDGDVEAAVRELKAKPGRDLLLQGSGALLRWLLERDLVDELNLLVYPVVLGDGLRLFPEQGQTHALTLVESQDDADRRHDPDLSTGRPRDLRDRRLRAAHLGSLAAHEFPEPWLIADPVEIRIGFCVLAELLGEPDRTPQVAERLGRLASEALAAGQVVEQHPVLRVQFDGGAQCVTNLSVLAGEVHRGKRGPQLPAARFVPLSGRAFDQQDRRPRLLGVGPSLCTRRCEHECPNWRIYAVAVELEHGTPAHDEEELLVGGRVAGVMFVDHRVTGGLAGPRSGAERRYAQMKANWSVETACVDKLFDLVQVRYYVTSQLTLTSSVQSPPH